MITWIQNLIGKHNRILFILLLAVIIVSFVFYVGQTPKTFEDDGGLKREFYGYNLESRVDMEGVTQAENISGTLHRRNYWGNEHRQYSVYERIIYLHLANKLLIPAPNKTEISKYIETLPYFDNGEGKFDRNLYDVFVTAFIQTQGISKDRALEIIAEDYRIDAVKKALEGPGYVLPLEAEQSLAEKETTWSINVAKQSYADFNGSTPTSAEAVEAYYKENSARYDIGEQIQISYVYFSNNAFKDKVSVPDEEKLKQYYEANRGKFTDKETFEAARADVEKAYIENEAQQAGLRYANDNLVLKLYQDNIKMGSEAFNALLAKMELSLTDVQPYSKKMQTSNGRAVIERYIEIATLRKAFDMTRYYSDAHPAREGVVVMFKTGTLPSVVPSLEDIKDRVTRDAMETAKLKDFMVKGEETQKQLAEKSKSEGFDFKKEAEALGLTVESYFNFKVDSPPEGLNRSLLENINNLKVNDVSEMIRTDADGYFVHLVGKTTPTVDKESDTFKTGLDDAMRYASQNGSQAIMGNLMQAGLDQLKTLEGDTQAQTAQ